MPYPYVLTPSPNKPRDSHIHYVGHRALTVVGTLSELNPNASSSSYVPLRLWVGNPYVVYLAPIPQKNVALGLEK